MSKAKTVVNLIDELTETLKEKDEEIKELQERIDKAIDYIRKEFCNNEDLKDCWHSDVKVILNVLKGDDK